MGEPDPILDLRQLGREPGLPALTTVAGRFLAESAAVCLDDQGHRPGVSLVLSGLDPPICELQWSRVTEQMRRTYHDLQDATESGANESRNSTARGEEAGRELMFAADRTMPEASRLHVVVFCQV